MVIAIDGPAGSGKSTVAKAVASRLGLDYLDTGAMYRSVAFAALRGGVDPEDAEVVSNLARNIDLQIDTNGTVIVDDVDATIEIRGPEVTRAVSIVAANPDVRKEMRARQRQWVAMRGGGVMEGRDIGTVVFPDAVMKVFLTASPSVRAARRVAELGGDVKEIEAQIRLRDELDSSRSDSPLRHDDDYIFLDTTEMDIDEVVDRLHREYVTRTN